jgi:glycosyltransferase involved in cell wall biosynthesis
MRPLKILLLTDGVFPFVMGGMQKHSYYLAKFLKEYGHTVHIAHCVYKNQEKPTHDTLLAHGYDPEYTTCVEFPSSMHFPGHYLYNSARYSRILYDLFKPQLHEFDLIYAQGFTAWKWGDLLDKPLIVNLHGLEMFQKPVHLKDKLTKLMLRIPAKAVIQNATVVQSLGGELNEILLKMVPKEKIWTSGIGVDGSWFISPNHIRNAVKPYRFVFVGRYEQRKGLHVLMPVLKKLAKITDFTIDFVGPIPENRKVINPKFIYHGPINDEKSLQKVLDNADILLLPSLSEGMPTVIIEAMARGLTVVATQVGAVEELVVYNSGFLIEAGNKDLLFKVLQIVQGLSPKHIHSLKKRSLEHIKKFAWQNQIVHYLAFFQKLVSEKSK